MSIIPIFTPVKSVFRIDEMVYDSVSYNTGSTAPLTGLRFTPGGDKFFTCRSDGASGEDTTINVYNLSTSFDVSSVSSTTTITVTPNNSGFGMEHLAFNGDGSTVFVMYPNSTGQPVFIEEHDLSGAYSGTGTYVNTLNTDDTESPGLSPFSFNFNNDGTKVFTFIKEIIKVSTLSTPYDLSTAGSWSTSLDLSASFSFGWSFEFGRNGKQLVVLSGSTGTALVTEYNLSTAYDPSTASASGTTFDLSTQVTGRAREFCYAANGEKVYVIGTQSNNPVFQYSTVA